MIALTIAYALVLGIYTCIARGHGMDDPASVQVEGAAPAKHHRHHQPVSDTSIIATTK